MTGSNRPATAIPPMSPPVPDAGRKRRSVMLALVHVVLAVGVLALFVFMQTHKG